MQSIHVMESKKHLRYIHNVTLRTTDNTHYHIYCKKIAVYSMVGIKRRIIPRGIDIKELKTIKLEKAGIVFSNRSSTKMLALNPAVFYWDDIMKLTREHILMNAQLLDKLWEMRGKRIKSQGK